MKLVIENVISADEEIDLPVQFNLLKDSKNAVVQKILSAIKNYVDFELCDESYCVLESGGHGHGWHRDTGTNNKMSWCKFGASILLKGDFVGGDLSYRDSAGHITKIINRKRYDLYLHSSDEEHSVACSDGNRRVFLLFV